MGVMGGRMRVRVAGRIDGLGRMEVDFEVGRIGREIW